MSALPPVEILREEQQKRELPPLAVVEQERDLSYPRTPARQSLPPASLLPPFTMAPTNTPLRSCLGVGGEGSLLQEVVSRLEGVKGGEQVRSSCWCPSFVQAWQEGGGSKQDRQES